MTSGISAQTEINFIDFTKLKGYDSVVVSSAQSKSVYIYFDGRLTKQKHFYEGKLNQFRNYSQNDKGVFTSIHNLSTIVPPTGKPYESWGDTYRIEATIRNNEKVTEKLEFESNGVDSILQYKTIFINNDHGILTKEKIYDYTTGLRNVFKSNSSEFANPYEKKNVEERNRIFKYETNKTIIEYIDKSQLKGKEIIEFSTSGQMLHVLSLGANNKKLGETIATYDKNGKIIYRRMAWYIGESLWGDPVDFTLPCSEKIFYNQQGLPEKVIFTPDGQPSEVFVYNYH
jgi:hypothetical protein